MSALRRFLKRDESSAGDGTGAGARLPDGPTAELTARRDELAERFAQLQWDLGGRGRVATVDGNARTLALDLGAPGATVMLTLPRTIEPRGIFPAQDVAVTATYALAGYALTGISADGDASAADDPSAIQGDQAPAAQLQDAGVTLTSCTLLQPRPKASVTE
jgi:hypothetical protein